MRWVVYILSFYILALACLPCNDAAESTVAVTVQEGHTDRGHGKDQCPPLCICACCSIQATPVKPLTLAPAVMQLMTSYPSFYINPTGSFKAAVWQPPQAA